MNPLRLFHRQDNGSTRRLQPRRRPLVEALEGRQLLSGIQGNHIGTSVMSADVLQRKHVGAEVSSPDIVGNHIGTNLA